MVRFGSNAVARSSSALLSQAMATCIMSDLDQNSLVTFRVFSTLAQAVLRYGKMRQTVAVVSGKGTALGPFEAGSCPGNGQGVVVGDSRYKGNLPCSILRSIQCP